MHSDERGFTTVQYVVAASFSLILFVVVANVLVNLYARGAVRDALDEGVRAAVPASATAGACEARARDVIATIVGGSVLHVHQLQCERTRDRIVARADISLRSWVPNVVPDWRLHLRASAVPER